MISINEPKIAEFVSECNDPQKFVKVMWEEIPAAAFMGITLDEMSANHSQVSIPFSWNSTNPFNSIYFIGLCAAGEMASGVVAKALSKGFDETILMLVSNVESRFFQKATDKVTFIFDEGDKLKEVIQRVLETRQAETFLANAIGKNVAGRLVASIKVKWWFGCE